MVGRLAAGAAGAAAVFAAGGARTSAAAVRAEAKTPGSAGLGDEPLSPSPAVPGVSDAAQPAPASAAPPWELVRPLAMGTEVAQGWHVAALSGVVDGACVLTLRNARGRTARVHVCRNDGAPQGLVHTAQFDLVVMNGGQGDLPTEEGLAQAVAAVAQVLAANEGDRRLVTRLLPHAERVRQLAGGVERRLR